MKFSILALLTLVIFNSCQSQASDQKKALEVRDQILSVRPGTEPTREGSWTMTAVIDGKKFKAVSVMRPSLAGRIIGYAGEEYISLPFSRGKMTEGNMINLTENYVADLILDDDIGIWAGEKGSISITKVGGDWVEGKFEFLAKSQRSARTFKVSDGYFRISIADAR